VDIKAFDIAILNLSNGEHTYEFEFGDAFFQRFKEGFIRQGNGQVDVILEKSASMIELDFHITGEVRLTCDRSLDQFQYPMDTRNHIILKFGEENREVDDEIEYIVRDTAIINVYKYIYDFIYLAIPMKKLHPRYEKSEAEMESSLVYSSKNNASKQEEKEIDPRWDALKGLKESR